MSLGDRTKNVPSMSIELNMSALPDQSVVAEYPILSLKTVKLPNSFLNLLITSAPPLLVGFTRRYIFDFPNTPISCISVGRLTFSLPCTGWIDHALTR